MDIHWYGDRNFCYWQRRSCGVDSQWFWRYPHISKSINQVSWFFFPFSHWCFTYSFSQVKQEEENAFCDSHRYKPWDGEAEQAEKGRASSSMRLTCNNISSKNPKEWIFSFDTKLNGKLDDLHYMNISELFKMEANIFWDSDAWGKWFQATCNWNQ